jgi:hypothetical protein
VTLPVIAERIACPTPELALILCEEEQRVRVSRDQTGAYALVSEAFDPATVRALRELRDFA